ncbi:DNA-3-methyladenine glycosylase I [Candidatus Dependentiae bacterium]|nr:DNA-3-methyladenine glycosylase I [Candidatus Dependentiae bacterium]
MKTQSRCPWAEKEIFHAYHDQEWGTPSHNDDTHFELLILEGAQAGLSWETVLKKRTAYREVFAHFSPQAVAKMPFSVVDTLMLDVRLIRNRSKLTSTIINAEKFLAIQKEFGSFNAYVWRFVNNQPLIYRPQSPADYKTRNDVSDALSKDLKKRGFKFIGTTIMYAYLQAAGLVDDHHSTCFRATK